MDLQLTGVRVLVTGSSSGIGAGIARVLAAEGAVVAVHGRDATRAAAVAEEIRSAGGEAAVVLGDLATEEGTASVADAVDAALGGVDVLVNNAGGKTRLVIQPGSISRGPSGSAPTSRTSAPRFA